MIREFLKGESGVTMIEYGLIAALVGVALLLVLFTIGGDLQNVFAAISTGLTLTTP